MRAEADRAALIDALRDGTIAAVATDHAPHSREEKDVPFEAAPFGVTGLETAFAALYTHLVEPGAAPARDAARADVGRARRGSSASSGRGSPSARRRTSSCSTTQATWRVREDRFRSRSANSWLLGRRLHGKVRADDGGGAGRVRGMTRRFLVLEDGTVFAGESVVAPGSAFGEAVFTTAMTGYQEVVTDPSYCGQIVCFTAPMVGNYGVADDALGVGPAARARRS